jgi:hypothetical protein
LKHQVGAIESVSKCGNEETMVGAGVIVLAESASESGDIQSKVRVGEIALVDEIIKEDSEAAPSPPHPLLPHPSTPRITAATHSG